MQFVFLCQSPHTFCCALHLILLNVDACVQCFHCMKASLSLPKCWLCGSISRGNASSLLPHSAGPPAVSWGCHSHTWEPHSQTTPLSGELLVRADILSSFFETGMLTRGSLSCAAASGTTSTGVRKWDRQKQRRKNNIRHRLLRMSNYVFHPLDTYPNRKGGIYCGNATNRLPEPPVQL